MKKQKTAIVIILLITVSISMGCLSDTTEQKTPDIPKSPEHYTITDDYNREVEIPKEVDKVVSTTPANTEILFSLNAGNKVVGVTNYADYPQSALNKTKIGGFQNPNLEKIIFQQPDVILASPQTGKKVGSMLESMGYPIVVLNPSNLTEVMENIELIGRIVDKEQKANNLTQQMQSKIEEIKTKTHREEPKTSLFIISGFGGNYWVAGQNTFINELIEKSGGINVAKNVSGYKKVGIETIKKWNPETIIYPTDSGLTKQTLLESDRWQGIKAIDQKNIYQIQQKDKILRPGPRIVEGLEIIAEKLHPEQIQATN